MYTITEASSSSSDFRRYDVFLSFRGEDTRHAFTGYLYDKLRGAGFHIFLDDYGIERGEDIKEELSKAIQESRSSIVVLSKDYPSSGWCLDELVMILRRRRSTNIGKFWVLPVFYEVDPSDLRKQRGSVAEAFREHERNGRGSEKITEWREALTEVANLAGVTFTNNLDGYEFKCINKIIQEVEDKLGCLPLMPETSGVGTDSRNGKISRWLEDNSKDNVDILVVCGFLGIENISIKGIYDENRERFDGGSFLSSVREFFERPNGLLELQRKLLSDILGRHKAKVLPPSPEDGWDLIRRALRYKGKFLLVLDGVDEPTQLDEILELKDWFSKGSKIVITTMRLDLLKGKQAHKVENLGFHELKELLCQDASHQQEPRKDYEAQAECCIGHYDGYPSAFKNPGSSLCDGSLLRRNDQLEKIKGISKTDIVENLKINYVSLEDDSDKNIFLDIACFFVGREETFTTKILNGCNFYATIGIQNLIDRYLLTIDDENKLVMHPWIEDMAKQIVREKFENYPEKRSRLFSYRDSLHVLCTKRGTEAIEGLILDDQTTITKTFDADAFKSMHKLRILHLNYAKLNGSFDAMPKKLKWLCWHGYPQKFIPDDFLLEELIALDMSHSSLKHLWKGSKVLTSLVILDLSHCHLLVETSDFSMVPNLEELLLVDCPNLVRLHASISTLEKLTILNLEDCKRLKKLPTNIGLLGSLEQLTISGCTSLQGLEETLEKMTSLRKLNAGGINPTNKGTGLSSINSIWSFVGHLYRTL